jgi:general stress protein 26
MTERPNDLKDEFWRELDRNRTGMLQAGAHQQAQPMTVFAEPETNCLFFFTRTDTDLAQAVQNGAPAQFILVSTHQKLWASARGALVQTTDRERIDRYWGPMVSAWYPEGKDDPRLTLLRMDLEEADIWVAPGNPIKVFWEVAKTNLMKTEPHIGQHEQVKLH